MVKRRLVTRFLIKRLLKTSLLETSLLGLYNRESDGKEEKRHFSDTFQKRKHFPETSKGEPNQGVLEQKRAEKSVKRASSCFSRLFVYWQLEPAPRPLSTDSARNIRFREKYQIPRARSDPASKSV